MKQRYPIHAFLLFAALFIVSVLVIVYSQTSMQQKNKNKKIIIVCSTSIIADTVRNIGGELVSVFHLMGPGVDPHIYRAKESDVHKLAAADIIFYNGLHLEGKMADIFARMQSYARTVAVTETIAQDKLLQSDFDNMHDPHVWHAVTLWMYAVEHIRDTLMAYDPTHQNKYTTYADAYLNELKKLDAYIKSQVKKIPARQRILVTAHDAFAYFGRVYGFNVVGLQGISTDAEVGIKDIHNLVDIIVQNQIRAIFIESSIAQRNIKAVQQAVYARNWQVNIGPELFSDALGNYDSAAGTYIGMIRHNIDAIVYALGKEQKHEFK